MRGWFGYLSSFAERSVQLPSFLDQHPRLAEYGGPHPCVSRWGRSRPRKWPERILPLKEHPGVTRTGEHTWRR